jgi:hypothetical protein
VKRELAKVKTERDILKKALGYFAKGPAIFSKKACRM